MSGSQALSAGWLLVLCTFGGAGIGVLVGSLVDARFVIGLVGGLLGTVAGFALVYKRYVVPANEADAKRDYSTFERVEDDDDDW